MWCRSEKRRKKRRRGKGRVLRALLEAETGTRGNYGTASSLDPRIGVTHAVPGSLLWKRPAGHLSRRPPCCRPLVQERQALDPPSAGNFVGGRETTTGNKNSSKRPCPGTCPAIGISRQGPPKEMQHRYMYCNIGERWLCHAMHSKAVIQMALVAFQRSDCAST
jgi:hypothetical protein